MLLRFFIVRFFMKLLEIKQKVRNFLAEFVQTENLDDDDNLFETGMLNSLFAMQLVLFIEKEFGFQVSNENLSMDNFKSINAVAEMIVREEELVA